MSSPEKTIIFHMGPVSGPKRVLRKVGGVISELGKLGATVGYTNQGIDQADSGEFAVAYIHKEEDFKVAENVLPYAIRDMTGRMSRVSCIPIVNDPKVLTIAQNKANFYELFQDVTAQTLYLPKPSEGLVAMTEAIDQINTSEVVIKPVIGHGANSIFIGKKDKALEYVLGNPELDLIVQELLENQTLTNLTPFGEAAEGLFSTASQAELRLFVTQNDFVPIGKIWNSEHAEVLGGNYAVIDIDKTPVKALDLARYCVRKVIEHTGAQKFFGAIDMIKDKDRWLIMEANVKEPGMPNIFPIVGDKVNSMLAMELVR